MQWIWQKFFAVATGTSPYQLWDLPWCLLNLPVGCVSGKEMERTFEAGCLRYVRDLELSEFYLFATVNYFYGLMLRRCGNVRHCLCYWCVSCSYYSRDISPVLLWTYLSSPDVSDCRPLCILLDYYMIILFNLIEFSSVQHFFIKRSGSRAQIQIIKPAQIFVITLETIN